MAVLIDQKQDRKITKLRRRQKEEGIQLGKLKANKFRKTK